MKPFVLKVHKKEWEQVRELNDAETAFVGGGSGMDGCSTLETFTVTPGTGGDSGNDGCDD